MRATACNARPPQVSSPSCSCASHGPHLNDGLVSAATAGALLVRITVAGDRTRRLAAPDAPDVVAVGVPAHPFDIRACVTARLGQRTGAGGAGADLGPRVGTGRLQGGLCWSYEGCSAGQMLQTCTLKSLVSRDAAEFDSSRPINEIMQQARRFTHLARPCVGVTDGRGAGARAVHTGPASSAVLLPKAHSVQCTVKDATLVSQVPQPTRLQAHLLPLPAAVKFISAASEAAPTRAHGLPPSPFTWHVLALAWHGAVPTGQRHCGASGGQPTQVPVLQSPPTVQTPCRIGAQPVGCSAVQSPHHHC